MDNYVSSCSQCYTSKNNYINARRCFMTGEHCSKQINIHKERERLHEDNSINAFVIMNFSNMSDVVYKWRIKPFIESLNKYLYFHKDTEKIVCVSSVLGKNKPTDLEPVSKINVIRSDSNPSSNYVICSRVCQQLQIADLVIVDVSSENTNVFYEFGMAVALGKMILPICYSESYYEMVVPDKIEAYKKEMKTHIGCYPWQKRLFEYYGIRYISGEDQRIKYAKFQDATNDEYGFEDVQYNGSPYDYPDANGQPIGQSIYEKLSQSYNRARTEHNTLLVYTMEGFLNENQAGVCIINFYQAITSQMKKEKCFGGDRVGVLVQPNLIPEDVKDARIEKQLLYKVGEIIHIGMNQATYIAQKATIKAEDFLKTDPLLVWNNGKISKDSWIDDVVRFVKDYISNKCILLYPNNPVYIDGIKSGLQKDVLNKEELALMDYFCLYHAMLRTLKYTYEIVVDISTNSLQALFWLGAAHGSDIYAVMVRHELTADEQRVKGISSGRERNIFDVSGLWMAELHSYDTDGFYRQLALVQLGIEQHSKLMLRNINEHKDNLLDCFFEERDVRSNASREVQVINKIQSILTKKEERETAVLESYYRDRFWESMLKYNSLRIYIPHVNNLNKTDGQPRLHAVKWDVDAIAVLSRYLSKRKIIGEYRFNTVQSNEADVAAICSNFICIGAAAKPIADGTQERTMSLAEYANRQLKKEKMSTAKTESYSCGVDGEEKKKRIYKGFRRSDDEFIYTQTPQAICCGCNQRNGGQTQVQVLNEGTVLANAGCQLVREDTMPHIQLAQLVLWREVHDDDEKSVNYWVSLTGASGPATLALTSLLVDDEQKDEMFLRKASNRSNVGNKKHMLSVLQASVRKIVMKEYINQLNLKLKDVAVDFQFANKWDEKKKANKRKVLEDKYFERIRYATTLYLSTILYRYFLPFLSREDEHRIILGMRTYITYMKSAAVSPFSLNYLKTEDEQFPSEASKESVYKVMDAVIEALQDVLGRFRGVEVIYQVNVESENGDRDTRKIKGITEVDLKNHGNRCDAVKCYFVE